MTGAFDAWLLIVGLVIGAGLTWLVLADSNRREVDVVEDELPSEAAWIASSLADEGVNLDQPTAERVLRLHRAYLASLPPDDPLAEPELEPATLVEASGSPLTTTPASTSTVTASTSTETAASTSTSTSTSPATTSEPPVTPASAAATNPAPTGTPPPGEPRSNPARARTTDTAGPAPDPIQ